ncbi:iron ABC transporter permease [uncultured Methanobrevibacter sp.]|uniref:FecCD family ABC transporter permease n=1 Tax=uncultured Methanobrevibacter sp. TaxID=253161 RepID=UPI0025E9E6FD|nr:iron ABC transporter permease [uncultured Methanobrevibacter sp.]MEE1133756.1 iron ABC transporter permease [Methanobrevibacter sp.]
MAVKNESGKMDRIVIYALLIALPVFLFFISFMMGRYPVAPVDVIKTILSPFIPSLAVSPQVTSIVFNIRLPRIIAALVVGASLAVAGASFQGIFQNPLVSPDLLGVSQGAGFGAAVAILLNMGNFFIQLSAFVFGIISVAITYVISKSYRAGGILLLVLSGTAVSAFFNALVSGAKFMADPYDKLPQIVYWLMGSLSSVNFDKLAMIVIPLIIGIAVIMILRWHLNVLSMGDEEAQSLGLNPNNLRILIITACTLVTSAAVSISGIIGWVGLVVPHMTRIIVGPDHKILLPASLSIGASFLLLIDNISRTAISIEVPIGILTAIIGVPIFLYLLRKGYSEWS